MSGHCDLRSVEATVHIPNVKLIAWTDLEGFQHFISLKTVEILLKEHRELKIENERLQSENALRAAGRL